MRNRDPLPIDAVLPRLRDTLRRETSAVLVAPPGAGKTTRVPLALLDEPWLGTGKIVMLEPRRLAARAAAHHMATLLGERLGDRVGYRVRSESRIGPRTRVEVVTEGVLTRMLIDDPTLDDIHIVIFDEFHERSVHADLGLALTLHSRGLLRDDLRVLVMSATLDASPVANLLGNAGLILSEGKSFPVTTHYVPPRSSAAREGAVLAALDRALHEDAGDILVFLPGAGEIRRIAEALASGTLPPRTYVAPLYGAMPLEEQDRAIRPSEPGARKVVLATTIAQTSLTIEGVRVVIDAGLTRIARYSPRTGMTRLETINVSRSAADQRRGRAGRLGPGICYRLWDVSGDVLLREHDAPEILEADLAPLALDLAAAGVRDPAELRWLDSPPAGAFAQASELLRELGALGAHGLTAHGKELAALGTHPRLAHMIVRARQAGHGALACDLAAIIEERDIALGSPSQRDPDLRTRIDALRGRRSSDMDMNALRNVRAAAERWRLRAGISDESVDSDATGRVLALAYPDRIGQRRPGVAPRYVLRNGAGAVLPASSGLHNEPYLVAAELDGRRPESLVWLAAPLSLDDIEHNFADQIVQRDAIAWDADAGIVLARRVRALGAIVLADDPLVRPNADAVRRVVCEAITASEFRLLNWTKEALALRARLAFLRARDASWLDVSTLGLTRAVEQWLVPQLDGVRRVSEIRRIGVVESLTQLLTWQQRAALDELAPTHFVVPSGSRIPIDYSDPEVPVLAVRLQEVFGLTRTPTVFGGRQRVTLHLLSPSQRPVQVTTDLESFWRTSYFDVRRELRGRYPKHQWPEDPLNAEPTRRTKRR